MKRTLSVLLALLFCLSVFVGCNNDASQSTDDSSNPKYKVTIRNADAFDIINELKDSYSPGEKVTVQLETLTEHYYVFYVNGVKQVQDASMSDDWIYTYYTFVMPEEDVIIEIEDRWVDIPEVD